MEKIRRLVHEIDWTDEVYRMLDRPEIPREYGFDSKFSKNKELIINEKKVYITVHELGCRMSQYLSMRLGGRYVVGRDAFNQWLKRNEGKEILSHGSDDLIAPTKTGRMNTASNLEHRMKVIMKNAGLSDIRGGLHIFRKTFATQMYEQGARVEEIAAYIGDLESTMRKYYIAIRKKLITGGEVKQIVRLPDLSLQKSQSISEERLQSSM